MDFAISEFREMKMQPAFERALRQRDILGAQLNKYGKEKDRRPTESTFHCAVRGKESTCENDPAVTFHRRSIQNQGRGSRALTKIKGTDS